MTRILRLLVVIGAGISGAALGWLLSIASDTKLAPVVLVVGPGLAPGYAIYQLSSNFDLAVAVTTLSNAAIYSGVALLLTRRIRVTQRIEAHSRTEQHPFHPPRA